MNTHTHTHTHTLACTAHWALPADSAAVGFGVRQRFKHLMVPTRSSVVMTAARIYSSKFERMNKPFSQFVLGVFAMNCGKV